MRRVLMRFNDDRKAINSFDYRRFMLRGITYVNSFFLGEVKGGGICGRLGRSWHFWLTQKLMGAWQIKYLRVPDEIIDLVKEQQQGQQSGGYRGRGGGQRGDHGGRGGDRGRGGRGGGRGRGRGRGS